MSEIQHTSLKGELLYLIGRASAPPSGAELYERCELADEIAKVSKALANLQSDGKIERVAGDGRARYKLAAGVAAPAPAGKSGRSKAVQADDAARSAPLTGIRPDMESGPPALDIPPLDDSGTSHQGAAGKTQRRAHPQPADHAAAVGNKFEAAGLADAIIARLKRDLGPLLRPQMTADLDVVTTTAPGAIHISVESVEINISIGGGA